MKTLFKILTSTISTLGIATISLASCGTPTTDGLVAIPTQYLNIDGTELKGLKPGDEGEYKDLVKMGYSKLTVPKNIKTVSINGGGEGGLAIGYKAITKMDYEDGSAWDTIPAYGISALEELTTIIFPPKLSNIGENAIILTSYCKLNTIDISNVENIDCLSAVEWIESSMDPFKGTLIIKHSQADKVSAIKTKNPDLKDFEIKEK